MNGRGFFVEATVFDDVKPDMTIAQEEIFGPVLAVLPVRRPSKRRFSWPTTRCTASPPASGPGTSAKAHRVAHAIRAGTVWINSYNVYDPVAPFGGYKQSGFGRDLGRHALENYTEIKTVWVGL